MLTTVVFPVFTKGTSIQTLPCLSKQLKAVTECIVGKQEGYFQHTSTETPSLFIEMHTVTSDLHVSTGLQYVWEYRSPSKSVPPHYQCKLCAVSRLQHDMLAHVRGWKHSFRYLVSIVFISPPKRHDIGKLFVIFI